MPFPDALKLALNGTPITRTRWAGHARIELVDGTLAKVPRDPSLPPVLLLLDAEDLQAGDWELCR